MKILKACLTKYGSYYILFDKVPEKTYQKIGVDYVGTLKDENGIIVSSHYLKKGPKGAFAGRELTLKMNDGSNETIQDYWWDCGSYPDHGEFINIGAGSLEELQECYVYTSFNINKDIFHGMLEEFLSENKFEGYDEIKDWAFLQCEWYPVKIHGKELPLMVNKKGRFMDPKTKKQVYTKRNLWIHRKDKIFKLNLFEFSYREKGRLHKVEATIDQVLKETLPHSEDQGGELCTT